MKNHIMKIMAIVAFFACALPITTKAQEKIWSLGPEIGMNFSKYGYDASGSDLKAGFIGGLALTYSIENTYAITGKFLFTQKGAKINGVKQSLNYIELPVIGRYFFNKDGAFRPNIFLGPSLGFLTNATNKIGENNPASIDNYGNRFRTVDLGITGGLGLNFLIARETRLLFDARYTHGFSDVTKASGYVNNKALSLTAGVSFGL